MRLSFLRWFALCLLLSTASFARAQYMAGDYGSWATGAWNTLSTWRVYDGVSWASSPTAVAVPNANNRVWVRPGTTVTAAFGSMYHCAERFGYAPRVTLAEGVRRTWRWIAELDRRAPTG